MDFFYFYRYELFAFSGLGFAVTFGLIIFKEVILEEKSLLQEMGLVRKPSSVLSNKVVKTLKVRQRVPAIKRRKFKDTALAKNFSQYLKDRKQEKLEKKKREAKELESSMESSKAFYDQFDSVPMHKLIQKDSQVSEEPLSVTRSKVKKTKLSLQRTPQPEEDLDLELDSFTEKELTSEEKDALKLALKMDEEVEADKGAV